MRPTPGHPGVGLLAIQELTNSHRHRNVPLQHNKKLLKGVGLIRNSQPCNTRWSTHTVFIGHWWLQQNLHGRQTGRKYTRVSTNKQGLMIKQRKGHQRFFARDSKLNSGSDRIEAVPTRKNKTNSTFRCLRGPDLHLSVLIKHLSALHLSALSTKSTFRRCTFRCFKHLSVH